MGGRKAGANLSRSVPEWIGKTDDTPAPPRVRLRVLERCEGKRHRGVKPRTSFRRRPADMKFNWSKGRYERTST